MHLTNYKNLLHIEEDYGYKFKEVLTTTSLINAPQLWFTREPKSAVWFFLDFPNSDQAFSAGFGTKSFPSISINIKKAATFLKESDLYIRESDNAVMIVGKGLFFPHYTACFDKKVQSKLNFKIQLKFFFGLKKNLL